MNMVKKYKLMFYGFISLSIVIILLAIPSVIINFRDIIFFYDKLNTSTDPSGLRNAIVERSIVLLSIILSATVSLIFLIRKILKYRKIRNFDEYKQQIENDIN